MSRTWLTFLLSSVCLLLLCSCSRPTPEAGPLPTAAPTVTSPLPSPTPSTPPTATGWPRSTRRPTDMPTPAPTAAPVDGYWIQNTTRDGLCSDQLYFIGERWGVPFLGCGDGTVAGTWISHYLLQDWLADGPDGPLDLPPWNSVTIPQLQRVRSVSPLRSSDRTRVVPFFAGQGGKCMLDDEDSWRCFTMADGLPFDDILAYGVVEETNTEWYLSSTQVASRGQQPQELLFSIPELVGSSDARATWMAVPQAGTDSVWVGTDGYGLIRIDPATWDVTRYTTVDGLPSDTIRDVQAQGDQDVWVATPAGVGYWDGDHWRAYTTVDGLPSDDVRGVSPGQYAQGVWAATAKGPALLGLGRQEWQTFANFPGGVELSGVQGDYFTTRGQGLLHFMAASALQGQVQEWTLAGGLPGGRVTALAATDGGVLVGTTSGAAEWDGQSWHMITDAAVNDAISTSLGTEDGLWLRQGGEWKRVVDEPVYAVAAGGWYATSERVCLWSWESPSCPQTADGSDLAGIRLLRAGLREGSVLALDGQRGHWILQNSPDGTAYFAIPDTLAGLTDGYNTGKINGLVIQPDCWLYATDRGLYCAGIEAGPYPDIFYSSNGPSWEPLSIRALSHDAETGAICAATGQGGFCRTGQQYEWRYIPGLPTHDLTAITVVPGGVWLGTADGRVLYFERSP